MTRLPSFVVKSLVLLLIAGGTFATNLHAQNDDGITVRVPFTFTVDTQSFPSGTYQFSLVSNSFLLSVVNVKNGHEKVFTVRPEERRTVEQYGRLIFRNSEECSTLDEIHFPGTSMVTEVIQRRGSGRIEARESPPGNLISVALR